MLLFPPSKREQKEAEWEKDAKIEREKKTMIYVSTELSHRIGTQFEMLIDY
jgi:hypothetical protein